MLSSFKSVISVVLIVSFWAIPFLSQPVNAQLVVTEKQVNTSTTISSTNRVIIKFKDQTTSEQKTAIYQEIQAKEEKAVSQLNAESITVASPEQAVSKLKQKSQIEYVEPDFIATTSEVPADSYYPKQWGLGKIKAPDAWNTTHGSSAVTIAIVDTGIESTHPDLSGKIVKRANFTTDKDEDGNGHGTHVAGIAASTTNNGVGIAGVGYDTKLMSVKALSNSGSGYYSWIADAIVWSADNGAKVINLSLGGPDGSQTLQNAIDYAWNKGVVIVAAAGNNGNNRPSYPGYYSNAIAVAATDSSDKKASFSTFGTWVDVAAPGVDIYSTYKGNNYKELSGTSMASPHVAGLAALIIASHPDWSNNQVRNKLETSSDKNTYTGTYWAYGRVNACAAVDCISSFTPTPSPSPSPSPSPIPSPSPAQKGLLGNYYNNADFTDLKLTRVDSTIDFDWKLNAPASQLDKDTFSVVWTGFVTPLYSQTYTFYTKTDDGVRLFIDNQKVIDNWKDLIIATEVSGKVTLQAGVKYPIRMEYYENTAKASAQLKWSSSSTPKQIIPAKQLSVL